MLFMPNNDSFLSNSQENDHKKPNKKRLQNIFKEVTKSFLKRSHKMLSKEVTKNFLKKSQKGSHCGPYLPTIYG
jgi:hypothetical protein